MLLGCGDLFAALRKVNNNAAVREAQIRILSLPNAIAITIDVGDPANRYLKDKHRWRAPSSDCTGGLVADAGQLKQFELTGADRRFIPAEGGIEATLSWSAARRSLGRRGGYIWSNHPEGCNLYNQAWLPSAPSGRTIGTAS